MSEPSSRATARFVLIFCTLAMAISLSACGPASVPAGPGAGAPDAGDVPDGGEIPEAGDAAPPEGPPAFPGAVGWAARTLGGRGGAILRVTTLELSGPGSLAEALGRTGPRIIVFEVGGV